jgi:hypothetical protein
LSDYNGKDFLYQQAAEMIVRIASLSVRIALLSVRIA